MNRRRLDLDDEPDGDSAEGGGRAHRDRVGRNGQVGLPDQLAGHPSAALNAARRRVPEHARVRVIGVGMVQASNR